MAARGLVNELNLSSREISSLIDEGIARTAQYVFLKSPFYRRRFEKEGMSPKQIRSADDLRRISPTTKADVAASGESFICVDGKETVDIVTTSGTTGRPVVYPLTGSDIERLGVNEHLSFSCAGLTATDTVLLAVTLDKCFMAGLAYYEGLRSLGPTAVRVGAGSPSMIIEMAERLRATAIVSVPSFLRRIADWAAAQQVDLRSNLVGKLVCVGEPVRTADFELNVLGKRVSESWGASVYSTYGATEIAGSMCECEAGCGGHAHPSLMHVEILNDDGCPVADGEAGEVVVTTFGVEAMPLVRFGTGDISFMTREKCPCGRLTPRIGPILGRKNEMLKLKGTTVFPAAVCNVLDSIPAVCDYVLIATAPMALSDELEVVVSVGDAVEKEAISESLKDAIKVTPAVRIADETEIARLKGEGYRKNRLFLDRRAAP